MRLSSLLGLAALFSLSQVTAYFFKFTRNSFYSPFHFAGGFMLAFFYFGFLGNYLTVVFLILITGLLWEIYEYLLWKFILKSAKFKPERQDTINDLLLDLMGGVAGLLILYLRISL